MARSSSACRAVNNYSLNWATYMARNNGVVIDGPQVNNQWFTDGYGDYIRHFLTSMQAFPEWAPAGQTHLTGSTSLVTNVNYAGGDVQYSTSEGGATDSLRVNFTPTSVLVDGVEFVERADLTQEGWTFDPASRVLRIRHDNGKAIHVLAGPKPVNLAPSISLSSPLNGATVAAGGDITLAANAQNADGTISKVDFFNGSTLLSTQTVAPFGYTWKGVPPGTYDLAGIATDNDGSVSSRSHAVVTVTASESPSTLWRDADSG